MLEIQEIITWAITWTMVLSCIGLFELISWLKRRR